MTSPPPQKEERPGAPRSILKGLERIHGSVAERSAAPLAVRRLVGNGDGMKPAEQGMRVQLAPNCKGNAVSGEMGKERCATGRPSASWELAIGQYIMA
jgi:hypothetical protein